MPRTLLESEQNHAALNGSKVLNAGFTVSLMNLIEGAGKMAQRPRAFTTLVEDLDSVPDTTKMV